LTALEKEQVPPLIEKASSWVVGFQLILSSIYTIASLFLLLERKKLVLIKDVFD